MHGKLYEAVRACFPGSVPDSTLLRCQDGFIVRYDGDGDQAESPGFASLKPHQDESTFSITVALNDRDAYEEAASGSLLPATSSTAMQALRYAFAATLSTAAIPFGVARGAGFGQFSSTPIRIDPARNRDTCWSSSLQMSETPRLYSVQLTVITIHLAAPEHLEHLECSLQPLLQGCITKTLVQT